MALNLQLTASELEKARFCSFDDLTNLIREKGIDIFSDQRKQLLEYAFQDHYRITMILRQNEQTIRDYLEKNKDECAIFKYINHLGQSNNYREEDFDRLINTLQKDIKKKIALILSLGKKIMFFTEAAAQQDYIDLPLLLLDDSYGKDTSGEDTLTIELNSNRIYHDYIPLHTLLCRYADSELVRSFFKSSIAEYAAGGEIPGNIEIPKLLIKHLVVNNNCDKEKVINSILKPLRNTVYQKLTVDQEKEFAEIANRHFDVLIQYCNNLSNEDIQQEKQIQEEVINMTKHRVEEFRDILKEVKPDILTWKFRKLRNDNSQLQTILPGIAGKMVEVGKVSPLVNICMEKVCTRFQSNVV